MRILPRIVTVFLVLCVASPSWAQYWVELTPSSGPAPGARAFASAVMDTQERKMVIFAGLAETGRYGDVWEFDLAAHTWAQVALASGSSPTSRDTPVSAYDPVGHRMITWSGRNAGVFFDDAWAFDLTTNTWSEYTPTGGPPAERYGAAGVFDPTGGDLVTFAGFTNSGRFDDVWRLDAAASTWTDVSAVVAPLERCLLSASYDSQGHRLIMYGGQNAGPLDDIWAFDLALEAWTELTPVVSPPGRWFASHVYDAANHRSVIFGGNTSPAVTDEVWVFDLAGNSWQQLSPVGTPPAAREGAAAVYDAAGDRMVVFGGRDGTPNDEVWALEDLSGVVTGAGETPPPPKAALGQNHPNPFNPSTTIAYELPVEGRVRLAVYDVRGRLVRVLASGNHAPGPHAVVWDGRSDAGAAVASGVYVYTLEYGRRTISRKLVLLK